MKLAKRTKWLGALAGIVVLYTLAGFLIVPAVIKSQLLKTLPGVTKRHVTIGEVKFNPFRFALTIDNFSLKETNGDIFNSFQQLYVNFQLSSIFKHKWVFDEVSLRDPFAQITYQSDGTFNFANLLGDSAASPTATPSKPKAPPAIWVNSLRIMNASISFFDLKRKTPFKVLYHPINVDLKNFNTVRNQSSDYEITAVGDSGERFMWRGDITLDPLRSSGAFQMNALKLSKYHPYSRDYARFEIVDGQIDAGASYRYDSATNALDLTITNAGLTLSRFQLRAPDTQEDVLTIPFFTITNAAVALADRNLEIGAVKSGGGNILVRQHANGTINFLENLVPQPAAVVSNIAPSAPPAPWRMKVDDILFENYTVKAEDKKLRHPGAFAFDQLGFEIKNVSNQSNAPAAFSLQMRAQGTGMLTASGTGTLKPLQGSFDVAATNLDLRSVEPYVREQYNLAIRGGTLGLKTRAQFTADTNNSPQLRVTGDVSVRDLAVTDEILFDNLVNWNSLDVTGIDVALKPDKFHIDQITFNGLKTSLEIGPDRRITLLSVLPPRTNNPAAAAPVTSKPLDFTLGALVFADSSLHFSDRSLEPNCTFDIQQIGGSIREISSTAQKPAALNLHGQVDAASPFSIVGRLNPMPGKLFTDITVTFTNTGLTSFSPYMEKYAGRPLNKGKLSLDLRYKIDQKNLQSTNGIFLDQLTLGAKNDSTNATTAPVKLAIALLKDRKGRILLNIPVQGRLDDPKFKVWPIIRGVIANLIARAAASPFSLLGSMFGASKELEIPFNAGSYEVPAAEHKTLDALGAALYSHPELSLDINGSVDPTRDHDALAAAKLQRQLKALYIKEITDSGKQPPSPSEVRLSQTNYERLVGISYTNAFGAYRPATNAVTKVAVIPAASPKLEVKPVSVNPRSDNTFFEAGAPRLRVSLRENEVKFEPRNVISHPMMATNAPVVQMELPSSEIGLMEKQLLGKIQVTADDYRELMQNRAREVQLYLLKAGKVSADRLYITAPRPVGKNFTGHDAVELSLN